MAGARPVAGHHQPPPERRRQRGDRRLQDLQVIGHRVAPRTAAAQHPGQWLAGVVAVGQQRMVAKTLVVRLCQFLVRVRRSDSGIQPDARHPLQHPVRHRHPGQGAMAGHDLRPRPAPGGVHRRGDPRQHPPATTGDLLQRPPARGNRSDQPEQLVLVAHHPEIADHLGAVRDRTGQVSQHPAPVMDQQPPRGQRPRQARRQPSLVRKRPQQRDPSMRHDARAIGGDFQALQPAGSLHLASAPRSGPTWI